MNDARPLQMRMRSFNLAHQITDKGNSFQVGNIKQPCPKTIVHIMRVVGNIIGNGRGLRFSAGKSVEI